MFHHKLEIRIGSERDDIDAVALADKVREAIIQELGAEHAFVSMKSVPLKSEPKFVLGEKK